MIGLDINDGFLGAALNDEEGKLICCEDLPYLNGQTSCQNEASLLMLVSQIHKTARRWGYGIAIEAISLSEKNQSWSDHPAPNITIFFPAFPIQDTARRMKALRQEKEVFSSM